MPNAGITNSYSDVTVIPEFSEHGRVVSAANGIYTCPAGKKAKVIGSMVLSALGADAAYAIAVFRNGDGDYIPIGEFVLVDGVSYTVASVVLEAEDILTMIGDSGSTNGTGDLNASIQEISI